MAGKKQKTAAPAEPNASADTAKKARTQQQPQGGIAAALAAAGQRATTDLVGGAAASPHRNITCLRLPDLDCTDGTGLLLC